MEKENLIIEMDSLLFAHRELLSEDQQADYLRLLGDARETAEEDELPLGLLRLYKALQALVYAESRKYFLADGQAMWIGPEKRANLRNAVEALIASGTESVDYMGMTLPTAMAKQALSAIEIYAAAVTLAAERHAVTILGLDGSDLDNYDYEAGYPEVLEFSVA